ncbi:unnamed protein product, partial [Allacma fusca]
MLRLVNHLKENLNENEKFNDKSQEQFLVTKERSREKAQRKKSTHRT